MAALVALLPAVMGGTAAAAGAGAAAGALSLGTILTGAGAAASVVSGLASMAQGREQAAASEMQARQIELQGRMDAVQTQETLLKNMATNTVAAASSGLASSGTPLYAQQASQQKANREMEIQRMNTSVQKAGALSNADAQRSKGMFGLATGVMTAGDKIGSALSTVKKTGKI